jgi:hypothetical protein
MPKRLSKKRPTDVNQLAHFLVGQTTEKHEETKTMAAPMPTKSEISRIMAAMGRKGGKKSAKARMGPDGIPAEKRSEIAANAARAMWAKKKAKAQS